MASDVSDVSSDVSTVTPGGATPPPASPAATAEFGAVRAALEADYEVLEELGRGGMAVVYRARERELDRDVAIKVLPAAMTFDNAFVERFQREARTAGQLEHPNIVPIYRVGRSGQVIYFVMKLLRGQSLAQILRERGKLKPDEVRHILMDAASALGYAAKRDVVHRDVKPDNILLDQEGRCIISDFGIAKTPAGPRTAAGTSMGTPRYMSPEHAQGIPLDGRSDMYSLGVVAYQCLVGTTPFDGDDPFAVLYKHINAPLPQPPLETDEEKELFRVISKMLAKRPEDRFQNADELISALGGEVSTTTLVGVVPVGSVATAPTQIIPTGPLARLRRYLPKGRRLWIDLGAGVAIIVLAVFALRPRATPSAGGATPVATKVDSTKATTARPDSAAARPLRVVPAVVVAPKPATPKPEPYSKCPTLSAALAVKAGAYNLLVDSIRDRKQGSKLIVDYDICGLAAGTAYTLDIEVRKTSTGFLGRGRVEPVLKRVEGKALRPRQHARQVMETSKLPPAEYWLDVRIMDEYQRLKTRRWTFKILETPQPAAKP